MRYPLSLVVILLMVGQAHATDFIVHVPDAQADRVLAEVYTRLGANADRNGQKDKSDSEKLAWCFQEVINYLSYVGEKRHTLEEYGIAVEVKRD